MILAATEPLTTAIFLSIFGLLIAVSVLFSRGVDRLGIPIVLLFLVLGMLGGSQGLGGIEFSDYSFATRVGTMALALILFDGGLNTALGDIRRVLYPATLLATVGVFLTAAITALFARLFGLPWEAALLLGAVVSSTDSAAVFAVLRGGRLNLTPQLARTLEVESCINDPMAVILTTSLIQVMMAKAAGGMGWSLVLGVPTQLAIGAVVGILFGYLGRTILIRVRLSTAGLYPALTLAIAFLSFGVATIVQGSGFLAVFTTGVILGNGTLPYRNGLRRIHDAFAWLSQISMFLMLGLLVTPSHLLGIAGVGLGVGLALAFVARPVAVILCMLPFGYPKRQVAYLSWVGLRGAVPIILGTFPVLAGVPGADLIFNLVFFIVVVSSIVPGATIQYLTRRMKLDVPGRPAPAAAMEISSTFALNGEITNYYIDASLAVCGAKLSEIEFPAGSAVVLIVRDKELIAPKGQTTLLAGDHVSLFNRSEDHAFIQLLFGGPEG